MAISPPSDIVLDVANAVSRTDLEAARAQLRAKVASKVAAEAFEASPPRSASVLLASPRDAAKPKNEAFVKFEAMVLQTFVQSMLPEKAEAVYGEGLSGDMWKSLLARELGQALAERGGVGIADRLLEDHYRDGEAVIPLAGVTQGAAKTDAGEKTMLSTALVQQMQRTLLQSIARDDTAVDATGVTASQAMN